MPPTKSDNDSDDSLLPNRYSEICMSGCPAWMTCRDSEGIPHRCPDCSKAFYVYTKKPEAKTIYSEFGLVHLEIWRFIEGIPEACPFLHDHVQYPHWCVACMRKRKLKLVE